MSGMVLQPLLHHAFRRQGSPKIHPINCRKVVPFSVNFCQRPVKTVGESSLLKTQKASSLSVTACSAATTATTVPETSESTDVVFTETFKLLRTEKVEGKVYIRLNRGEDADHWQLTVGCSLPGKWVLHWGVHYVGESGSEWEQPPDEIRPPDSIAIKDYAIETPLKKSASENGESVPEVNIYFNSDSKIAAINFVLKDEETGSWYQHKDADFVVPLVEDLREGNSEELPKVFVKSEGSESSVEDSVAASPRSNKLPEGFYEELPLVKKVSVSNSLTISVRKCPETSKNIVLLETDLPGEVVVHWGVCRDNSNNKWEVPEAEHPPNTEIFKNKALRTKLQVNEDGSVAKGLFTLDIGITGFPFALKLNGDTWLNNKGSDYFIPLTGTSVVENVSEGKETYIFTGSTSDSVTTDVNPVIETEEVPATFTDGIIKEIRHIVSDISVKRWKTKSKEAQETILQEIERLAAEAYSIFRSSSSTFSEEAVLEIEKEIIPAITIKSGTGSGYEILCQGFNWESHKSGKWYLELEEKSEQLASLGFTIIWLPPPTDSVSPEGYMPRDLYDLNSRYGTFDELKAVVEKFHKVGIKVLGDVVLNHRCAHFKNQNGIWNMFGGRLNWDDRAVVADDPHFQGRGNKSNGDFFHAAPNIDHSQEFVRNDIKEWLCWLRKDIGYDGWRLDFVRGFWGGYVKDYIEASEPYFSVGEFWDSLRYSYGEMDYNQDPHRQRIIDWISATGGMAGAFDVTTKGILHSVMERCEYWRLCDPNGKPPGVVGWWPSRAITFIENHDTGSTQGHWRFPEGKEMQGYAYILTHPGTPSVFYDHIFSHYHSELASLLSIRTRKKINCRSSLKIAKAEKEVYAAIIDNKVAMKIGPGHYEPPSGSQQWSVAAEGRDYKIWEAL